MNEYPYVFYWNRIIGGVNRKGQRCRYVTIGKKNTAEVEFDDGTRTITARMALRRCDGEK